MYADCTEAADQLIVGSLFAEYFFRYNNFLSS